MNVMISQYNLKPFDKHSKEADVFFSDIDTIWKSKGGTEPVSPGMKKKIFKEKKFQMFPYLLYKNEEAVGITWVELSTPSYGNITCHVPEHEHIKPLMTLLKDAGYFDNKIMEIVNIEQLPHYKDACYQLELIPNIRQRMCLWLNTLEYYVEGEHPFTFRQLEESDLEWSGTLSSIAHQISKDYVHYDEMTQADKRIELEKLVWKEHYGKVIRTGSIIVEFNGKDVGYCSTVEVNCWGYERVPWIFDICIDPAYHGQGIGKALSKYFINNLMEEHYDVMGLAVTLTNKYAIKLYEDLGFQYVDTFYEFINPIKKS